MKIEEFESYMKTFKTKPLSTKKSIVLKQLQSIAKLTSDMCDEIGVDNSRLEHSVDIITEDGTEDDFVEAVMVYASSIQDSICSFDNKICDVVEETIGK